MRESSYVRSRRTTACGGTVFRHAEANGPGGTAQVVEHLGYPTRQCLERWLAKDFRYAGHMAKRGADAFLEVASQPFAGGTISRCWHILFTR